MHHLKHRNLKKGLDSIDGLDLLSEAAFAGGWEMSPPRSRGENYFPSRCSFPHQWRVAATSSPREGRLQLTLRQPRPDPLCSALRPESLSPSPGRPSYRHRIHPACCIIIIIHDTRRPLDLRSITLAPSHPRALGLDTRPRQGVNNQPAL